MMLSVVELPVSEAAIRSGVDGAGAVVSIVTDKAADSAFTFPAMSVAVAVMLCAPCVRVDAMTDQLPEPSAAALPIWVVPSNSMTVLFASAVPLKVIVRASCILTVAVLPVADAAYRWGADGVGG